MKKTENELKKILELHKNWLSDDKKGEKANLRWADLSEANLVEANLRWADLRGADLGGANLSGANLDFSCLPLWCGSLNIRQIDDRFALQLFAHVARLPTQGLSPEVAELITGLPETAKNGFCRFREEVKPLKP